MLPWRALRDEKSPDDLLNGCLLALLAFVLNLEVPG